MKVQPTIGTEFSKIIVPVTDRTKENSKTNISLQIWDTCNIIFICLAGAERFRAITNSHIRNSDGILIVYDVTKKDSFDSLTYWLDHVLEITNDNCIKFLLGNKIDLVNQREVSKDQAMNFFIEHNNRISQFYEVSALTLEGFDIFFPEFCGLVYDHNKSKVHNRLKQNQRLFEKNKYKNNKYCC